MSLAAAPMDADADRFNGCILLIMSPYNFILHFFRAQHRLSSRWPPRIHPLRLHAGKIALQRSDQRYCSDGFESAGDNGAKMRVTFSRHCRDRRAIAFAATTAGISGGLMRDG